jgi:hypothetical protein
LKEAAAHVGDIADARESQQKDLSENNYVLSQVKKRKLQDEKDGWLDLTEVLYFFLFPFFLNC